MMATEPSRPISDPLIPYEIIELIVGEIAGNTPETALPTLHACSLTSWALASICRPHIFRKVTIGPVGSQHRAQKRLQQLLTDTPTLSRYIRILTYVVDNEVADEEGFRITELQPEELSSYAAREDPMFSPFLPDIDTLRVENGPDDNLCQGQPCALCDFSFLRLLRLYIFSETLTTISAHDVGRLSMFSIFSVPNLQNLELRGCRCIDWTRPYMEHPFPHRKAIISPPRLRMLTVADVDNFSYPFLFSCDNLEAIKQYGLIKFTDTLPDFLPDTYQRASFSVLRSLDIGLPSRWLPLCNYSERFGTLAFPKVVDLKLVTPEGSFDAGALFDHMPRVERAELTTPAYAINEVNPRIAVYKCLQNSRHALKHIDIHWSLYEYDETIIKVLCDGLASIRGQNMIESLHISFNVCSARVWIQEHVKNWEFPQWGLLDGVLSNDRWIDFACLNKVFISLKLFDAGSRVVSEELDRCACTFKQVFQGLHKESADLFCFICIVEYPDFVTYSRTYDEAYLS
ncbi:hypothetical protein BJ165DRAFT_1447519 [Panaeolus papilionaceus]|nr:hypothetical protein BJ165DRAFT_1447519 [Panaeolus papilionaceus]